MCLNVFLHLCLSRPACQVKPTHIQKSRRYLLWGHLKSCSDAKPTQYVSKTRFKSSKKKKQQPQTLEIYTEK